MFRSFDVIMWLFYSLSANRRFDGDANELAHSMVGYSDVRYVSEMIPSIGHDGFDLMCLSLRVAPDIQNRFHHDTVQHLSYAAYLRNQNHYSRCFRRPAM